VKRPTMLVEALLRQAALDLDLSVERDIVVIRRRCEHEGMSFLTITLPVLSDCLERGLETGFLTCPTNFCRDGSLPRLLGGFFRKVFNRDGRLLPDACPESIYWIRQIARFFKKLKIRCNPRREAKAIQHFLAVEGELHRGTSKVERKDYVLDSIAGIIWSQLFPEIDYLDLVCHHGPGVTADRFLSNERNRIRQWNTRSEVNFPSDLHCYPNYGYAAEQTGRYGEDPCETPGITYLGIRDEVPVRVVFVPKTLTAPRVIAIEPSHMQFMQQSVKDLMYDRLEKHRLTKRSIRFVRQDVNQRLAYIASIDRRLATLDLKDASDRVHLHLVQRIFKNSGLLEYLEDARSLHATLPNNQNVVLWKYASMGSALCFPVEACVFYTLIQSAMHQLDGIRPSSRSIEKYSRLIDIYGDDIVVPVEYSDTIVRYLESYLLKVNVSKSFKDGNFRESCGADYFKGVAVKPVYARQVPFDDARDWGAEHVMSWNATANLFYQEGKWLIAQTIRDMLRQVVKRSIPRARKPGAGLFHFSYLFDTNLKWNRDLCGWKQKRIVYQPTKKKDDIDGNAVACLNKWGQSLPRDGQRRPFTSNFYAEGPSDGSETSELRDLNGGEVPGSGSLSESSDRLRPASWDARLSDEPVGIREVPHKPGNEPSKARFVSGLEDYRNLLVRGDSGPGPEVDGGNGELLPFRSHRGSPVDLRYVDPKDAILDFSTSVKRGSFKSKCRWVAIN